MDEKATTAQLAAERLLDLYPRALPAVYGFLCSRCGDTALAEDLTAESLGRGVHATEALLQRARRALRRAYVEGGTDAG